MHAGSSFYSILAVSVLFLHALFILWVVFGALLTRSCPILRWLHIASLVWGILTESLPWPCPLTVLENWLEGNAGVEPYQGGFPSSERIRADLGYTELVDIDEAIRRTIAWEQSNPPTTIDPQQFNYDAEDAALASGGLSPSRVGHEQPFRNPIR